MQNDPVTLIVISLVVGSTLAGGLALGAYAAFKTGIITRGSTKEKGTVGIDGVSSQQLPGYFLARKRAVKKYFLLSAWSGLWYATAILTVSIWRRDESSIGGILAVAVVSAAFVSVALVYVHMRMIARRKFSGSDLLNEVVPSALFAASSVSTGMIVTLLTGYSWALWLSVGVSVSGWVTLAQVARPRDPTVGK